MGAEQDAQVGRVGRDTAPQRATVTAGADSQTVLTPGKAFEAESSVRGAVRREMPGLGIGFHDGVHDRLFPGVEDRSRQRTVLLSEHEAKRATRGVRGIDALDEGLSELAAVGR